MKIYKCEILHDDEWFTHHYTAERQKARDWWLEGDSGTRWLEEIEVEDWPESPAETTSKESSVAEGT